MADMVIFDLDGTLLDTSRGIFNSVRYVEKELNLIPILEEDLRKFVGPPPKEMYKKIYGLDDMMALKAAKKHRQYGAERAVYEAEAYDGIKEVLAELRQRGYKLGVATLKKQDIAEAVLKNFEMSHFFDAIVGMDENESYTKCMTITKAMETVSARKAIVVGDSVYDFEGAQLAKTEFIGVLYGFGFAEGEKYFFKTVSSARELLKIIPNAISSTELE